MAQDIVSDALNQIMNSKRVGKKEVVIRRYSKLLLNLFDIMKDKGSIEYNLDEDNKVVSVKLIKLNECRAIKPRFFATVDEINKYLRRFLPSRNFGSLIVSTNKGLLTHEGCYEKNVGGAVVAYFY